MSKFLGKKSSERNEKPSGNNKKNFSGSKPRGDKSGGYGPRKEEKRPEKGNFGSRKPNDKKTFSGTRGPKDAKSREIVEKKGGGKLGPNSFVGRDGVNSKTGKPKRARVAKSEGSVSKYQLRKDRLAGENKNKEEVSGKYGSLHKESAVQAGIRLNKFIANSGICSRREADVMIQNGVVTINGKIMDEVGYRVKPTDEVRFDGRAIIPERPVYLLLNKPKDYITTTEDPQGRKTVMALIKGACKERVFPVGRLDRNTTGLLLFTNDGDMADKLIHPRKRIKKIYQVELDKNIKADHLQQLREGITLEDGPIKPDSVEYAEGPRMDKKVLGVEIHSGRNRIVRRMFEHFGYKVVKLDRVYLAGLTKKNLPRGQFRMLEPIEVNMLKML